MLLHATSAQHLLVARGACSLKNVVMIADRPALVTKNMSEHLVVHRVVVRAKQGLLPPRLLHKNALSILFRVTTVQQPLAALGAWERAHVSRTP